MTHQADIIVVGGGIAGASVASLLAEDVRVVLLEAESRPGFHATGRSAAYYAPAYGNAVVRNLTAAGEGFYRAPPDGFSDVPLLRPRAAVFVATKGQRASVDAMRAGNDRLEQVDSAWLSTTIPILKPDVISEGLLDVSGGDLDVDAILQGYLKRFRRCGGSIVTSFRVESIVCRDGTWQVRSGDQAWQAPIVVNAAGAWADHVARLAGMTPLGLVPKRRTAILIDAPANMEIADWPLVIGILEDFYFKPDAGKLLVSPADETPVESGDAQPEEIDIALAVDRLQRVADIEVQTVRHRWAGLRTFAPDKSFVVGFDPRASGFFWLAGQGGYGVQSAPGLSELARHLLTGNTLPAAYARAAHSVGDVAPERLCQDE